MRIVTLTSSSNPLLKRIRSLHERQARHKAGLFLIEGETIVLEAFQRDIHIEAVLVDRNYFERGFPEVFDDNLIELNVVEPALFKTLVTTSSPCSVLAVARVQDFSFDEILARCETKANCKVVVLENLQDPGNLGTIVRSALAFNADAMLITRGSVDIYNPKVVRSAMGALFELPIATGVEVDYVINKLKQAGFEIIGLNPEGDRSLTALKNTGKKALLIGNEGNGLSEQADGMLDHSVFIPMNLKQVESLNAAIATSIVLYHLNASADA